MCESKTLILDPTGIQKSAEMQLAPRPIDLKGLTVGLFDYGRWVTFGVVLQHYRGLLKERFGVADVIYVNWEKLAMEHGTRREETIEKLASTCDVIILGLGRGSNTSKLALDAVECEKRGIPTVIFVTDWFQSMAVKVARGAGLADPRLVAVPHPFDGLPEAEALEIADKVLGKAIAAITSQSEEEWA